MLFGAVIAVAVACATFFIVEHYGARAVSAPHPQSVAVRNFSGDGYSFGIPVDWNIERTASGTVAVHPVTATSGVACKIEMSSFSYASGTDMADWISRRIGEDPSLAVVEHSTENISLASGTGVEWVGTIDGIPTNLVYAFNGGRAYEIAPSVIGEGPDGSVPCDEVLRTFLSGLTI